MRIFREARRESTTPFILVAGEEDGLAFGHNNGLAAPGMTPRKCLLVVAFPLRKGRGKLSRVESGWLTGTTVVQSISK